MCDVEEYEDTINPFDVETAKRYVYAHRNIFSKDVKRRVIYEDMPSLIIVKEITTSPMGDKEVWYWGFTPTKRAIAKNCKDNDEAVDELRRVLSPD